jgi:hypothetical protein
LATPPICAGAAFNFTQNLALRNAEPGEEFLNGHEVLSLKRIRNAID